MGEQAMSAEVAEAGELLAVVGGADLSAEVADASEWAAEVEA